MKTKQTLQTLQESENETIDRALADTEESEAAMFPPSQAQHYHIRKVEAHAERLADALKNLEAELQMAFDDVPAGVDAWMAIARKALAQWEGSKQ